MEQKPQIEIRGLCKDYPIPGGEVHALSNISLTIDKGDIYGIIGMSGAGKSTLIRCLNRLDTPTDGQIFIDGENILAMSKQQLRQTRRRMAMIFQQFNLLMQKSVARNVRYPLEIAGVPKKQANERVIELLKIVGLEDKASAYPAQLSGGQKQRVAIARALASDPEMLLCDEATSALDPMTTQSILSLLQKINRELGITVVLITHEMAVIRQICNKVAILDGGKLAEQGTVDDVFMHTKSAAGRLAFCPSRRKFPRSRPSASSLTARPPKSPSSASWSRIVGWMSTSSPPTSASSTRRPTGRCSLPARRTPRTSSA